MVIVVTGPATFDTSQLATALAERLGWPLDDGSLQREEQPPQHGVRSESPGTDSFDTRQDRSDGVHRNDGVPMPPRLRALRERIAAAMERRQSVVLTSPLLSDRDYVRLREGLRTLRVVSVGRELDGVDATLTEDLRLDAAADIDTLVGHVRLAFGI